MGSKIFSFLRKWLCYEITDEVFDDLAQEFDLTLEVAAPVSTRGYLISISLMYYYL